jgi:DNA-binding NarL/FixJ family response regulator
MPETILIADDHRLLREGLRALLEREGFQVVAEADNGRSAVKLAKQLQPDIVITDIAMPDLNGVEATRQICAEAPRSKVLALSMHTESRFVLGILEAGASGYLMKDSAFE